LTAKRKIATRKGGDFFATEVRFRAKVVSEDDDAESLAILVSLWRNNGQVLGKTYMASRKGRTYSLYLVLPELSALAPEHNSPYATQRLEQLEGAGFKGPMIRVIGRDPFERAICACRQCSHFILFTNYAGFEPSLLCGDCFHPVPLYRIPYELSTPQKGALHDRLCTWQSNYRSCDQLNMSCSVGRALK
jgi:predicted  nucleic acid-binding Zn ribbon protein